MLSCLHILKSKAFYIPLLNVFYMFSRYVFLYKQEVIISEETKGVILIAD